MKPAFCLSIVGNIVLMGTVGALLWREKPLAPPTQPAAVRTAIFPSTQTTRDVRVKPAGSTLTPAAVTQLERMGITRATLMSVLLEDLDRRSAKRVLDLQKKYAPKRVPEREMRDLVREGDAERISALKETFGQEGYLAWDKEQTLRNLNGARAPGDELPMSDEESQRAYQLQKAYDEKSRDLQVAMEDGIADKSDAGALQERAQKALDEGLEALLGKQRFDALRGNSDPTAVAYQTYGDLNPTPDQANAVVQAEADYRSREAALAQQLSQAPGDAANLAAQLQAINDARDANLRQIFGAEAYDAMKRESDPTYQALQLYSGAWNLNDNEVQQVYASVHDFQQQADLLRSTEQMSEQAGQKVDWGAVNASIEQVQQQTELALQNTIGAERLSRLKQNGLLTVR